MFSICATLQDVVSECCLGQVNSSCHFNNILRRFGCRPLWLCSLLRFHVGVSFYFFCDIYLQLSAPLPHQAKKLHSLFCVLICRPYLPEEVAVSVVRVLVAVDGALLSIWGSLGAFSSWLLWALDGVLSSLVWPSLEDLKSAVAHPNHRSLLNDILVKVKDMAHHLPEAPPHPEF